MSKKASEEKIVRQRKGEKRKSDQNKFKKYKKRR